MNANVFAEFANEIIKMSRLVGSDRSIIEGLTPKQVHILMEIGEKTYRHGDLADILGVEPSTLTRTLNPLAHSSLIDRYYNPANRREVLIRLTEKGLLILKEINEKMNGLFQKLMNQIPSSKQKQVEDSLTILLKIIKSENFTH